MPANFFAGWAVTQPSRCGQPDPYPLDLRHEWHFPELAEAIRDHYVLMEEVQTARIYWQKDLVAR